MKKAKNITYQPPVVETISLDAEPVLVSTSNGVRGTTPNNWTKGNEDWWDSDE